MLTADPAVAWTAENTQISLTDPTTNELVVTPEEGRGPDPDLERGCIG